MSVLFKNWWEDDNKLSHMWHNDAQIIKQNKWVWNDTEKWVDKCCDNVEVR